MHQRNQLDNLVVLQDRVDFHLQEVSHNHQWDHQLAQDHLKRLGEEFNHRGSPNPQRHQDHSLHNRNQLQDHSSHHHKDSHSQVSILKQLNHIKRRSYNLKILLLSHVKSMEEEHRAGQRCLLRAADES